MTDTYTIDRGIITIQTSSESGPDTIITFDVIDLGLTINANIVSDRSTYEAVLRVPTPQSFTMTGTMDSMDYSTLLRGVDEEDSNAAVRDRAIEIIDTILGNNAIALTDEQEDRLVGLLADGDLNVGNDIRTHLHGYSAFSPVTEGSDEDDTDGYQELYYYMGEGTIAQTDGASLDLSEDDEPSESNYYLGRGVIAQENTNAFMDQILAEEARHADIREIDLPLEDGTLLHPLRNPSSIAAGVHMRKVIEKKKKSARTERLIRLEKDD